LGTELYAGLAHSDPVLGARAKQIRDALAGLTNATPADVLTIQLDDRALLLEPWRQLLLTTLRDSKAAAAITNDLAEVVRCVSDWNGRATADAVGYRLVRGFRLTVLEYVFEPLTVKVSKALGQRVGRHLDGGERPVWALLGARPPHLLNPRFASYDDLLLTAIGDVVKQLRAVNQGDLRRATWGQSANQPIQHPFSDAVPALSRWLGARTEGCSGGDDMPRVHGGGGAVERLVVSPGHEDQGLFHMPGGQSGHFLSPFYRAGHDAWIHGKPTPLLPGPARHTLKLLPAGAQGPSQSGGNRL
jgi:penicillin amidase